MWRDLSMTERARYIKLGIDNNISDIKEISRTYNRYADGGYKAWKEKAKQWREGIDIDTPNTTYDYEGFFNEDPQRAWDMINNPKSEEHFTDRYKLPNHPTFSDESKYSTHTTPGGHWSELNGKSFYIPSEYTNTPERIEDTRDYLMNTGEGYAIENEVHYPSTALDSEEGYTLPEIIVNSKGYGGTINKFDGLSTPSNQMNRVQYVDTRGNIYNDMPEGFVRRSQLTEKGKQIADDLYRENNPVELDELAVYPSSGKGAKSTNIGSYYDKVNTMTEANIEHAKRVAQSDALVRETSAFEKPLNFLSPGQWFGAAVDYYQGEHPFWEGIYNGNSGWVTDNYAREHPGMAALVNMFGDAAFGELAGLTYKNIRTGVNRYNYERGLYNNIDNFNTVTPDDISRIVQRRYPYTHERINPFTSNSRWGRKFRANVGRIFYPDAEMPTVYRKTNPVPDIVEGNIQMTNPRTRWVDTNDQPFTVTNMTTDLPVRPHKTAKRGWMESNAYAYSGNELLDYDLWSTRPSDTFSVNEHVEVPVNKTRVVSGDTEFVDVASQKGLNVTTNEELQRLYREAASSDRFTKADYGPYAKAVQEEITSSYRRPTAKDYKYMDFVYRPVFRSNVFDKSLFTEPIEAVRTVYGKSPDELDPFRLRAFEEDWFNSNVLYDSSTPAEHGLRGILGIKQAGYGYGGKIKKKLISST